MFRYRVAQDSMAPNLLPGEEFVVVDTRTPTVGEIVTTLHPRREDFWIVKRVVGLEGDTVQAGDRSLELGRGEAWVVSDNQRGDTVDSENFGPVNMRMLRPRVELFDESTFDEAVVLLTSEDAALRRVTSEHGRPEFWRRPKGFATLVLLILEQQVTLESGAAVFRRLQTEVGAVTPARILRSSVESLNRIGLTRQKSSYVLGLAEAVATGRLDLADLSSMPTDQASAELQRIRGIGRWTAEAYLLSADSRLDLFPTGDRALQVGTGEALGMTATPSSAELEVLSEPWRPIRSAAARILWHGYLARRGRSEPEHLDLDVHESDRTA